MQNVIRKRARAREARLPSDGRLLGNRSFFKSAHREISFIASPFRLTTVHHHGTRARQEESSRRAEIGARPFPARRLGGARPDLRHAYTANRATLDTPRLNVQ